MIIRTARIHLIRISLALERSRGCRCEEERLKSGRDVQMEIGYPKIMLPYMYTVSLNCIIKICEYHETSDLRPKDEFSGKRAKAVEH